MFNDLSLNGFKPIPTLLPGEESLVAQCLEALQ